MSSEHVCFQFGPQGRAKTGAGPRDHPSAPIYWPPVTSGVRGLQEHLPSPVTPGRTPHTYAAEGGGGVRKCVVGVSGGGASHAGRFRPH